VKKSLIAAALLAASVSANAHASEMNYTYVQVEYVSLADAYDINLDGAGVRGSVALGQEWYLTGDYADTGASEFGLDLDVQTFALGLGYHSAINDQADFIAEVAALSIEAELLGFSESDQGYRGTAGVRWQMGDNFEATATANYTSYREIGGGFHANLGAHFKINENFGIVAEYQQGEIFEGLGESRYSAGIRASF
jgi:opacity protein-like surface antigen